MNEKNFDDANENIGEYVDSEEAYDAIDWEDPEDVEDEDEDDSEERRRPRRATRILAVIVILAFLGISLPNIPYLFSERLGFMDESQALLEDDLVKLCRPAVVSVVTQMKMDKTLSSTAKQGTGFNISPSGKIITNRHVVEGAETITIRFADGSTYYSTRCDIVPDADIAILTISGEDLPALVLNREDPIREGDKVTVIGNPLGYEKIAQRGEVGHYHVIQDSAISVFDIDIAINPGNSGSPVINERGEVIGVIFAMAATSGDSTSANRGLAIPINALPKEYFANL